MQVVKNLNRCSKLFQPITAIKKDVQLNKEITSKSQRLMLDVGIIRQSSPGSFHLLPLGVRAFNKLINIVDEEMGNIDAQKVIFPSLTNAKLWQNSGRINEMESELFTLKDRHENTYILSPTHEESAADLLASLAPISYKQFPLRLYQTTSKYRDEMKPRFGLMRARQFFMKDLYCFDVDLESAQKTYEVVCDAYDKIFKRIGIHFVKVLGSSGNMGGSVSHEYHFPADIGEDKIVVCSKCNYSFNLELSKTCLNCGNDSDLKFYNGIEVGHTFLLGDKYSKPLKATFLSQDAHKINLQMGSYGLGLSRILAAAIEVLSLDHEIRWPAVLAPFSVIIITPKAGSKEEAAVGNLPEELYSTLDVSGVLKNNVLLDDRKNFTIGRRILDARRTGYPFIVAAGVKTLENPPLFEVIKVETDERFYLTKEQTNDFFMKNKIC